jgi:acetylxylan esterase
MSLIRLVSFLVFGATLAAAQCPQVHVFGARETTVSPGYGTSGPVVNSIVAAYSGATSEAISYPACGGQASCGGVSYASSAVQGVAAVASQVNSFNQRCPNTVLVLVGYSQVWQCLCLEVMTDLSPFKGGQIMDDAYCGGGDLNEGLTNTAIPISTAAQAKIAAAIFMGDPRHIPGLSFNVGSCQASGVRIIPIVFLFSFSYADHAHTSSLLAPPDSNARTRVTSSHTAIPPTRTAATEMMLTPTKATPMNMAP